MGFAIEFTKPDLDRLTAFFYKKKALLLSVFLFGLVSNAQTSSIDVFVSEGTQVVGLENIHSRVLDTQITVVIDSFSVQNENTHPAENGVTNVQLRVNQPKKHTAKHFNNTKKTATPSTCHKPVVVTEIDKRNSSVFSTDNSPFCSINITQQVHKKLEIVDSSFNFISVFRTKKTLLYFFNLNSGFKEVNHKLYFNRPPPEFFS